MQDLLLVIVMIVIGGVVLYLWLLPGIIADKVNHPQRAAIWACVFCALLFPLTWIVAIVWVNMDPRKAK